MSKTIVITGASDGNIHFLINEEFENPVKMQRYKLFTEEMVELVLAHGGTLKAEHGTGRMMAPFVRRQYGDELYEVMWDIKRLIDPAASLIKKYEAIDVLANNAGVMFGTFQKTVDGFERTFQVNHLAPFLLTHLLHDKLVSSKATVVNTSSMTAKMWGQLDLGDLNNEISYDEKRAYGTAKLCNILFTKELDRRYRAGGIKAVAFHPGVVSTNFASDPTSAFHKVYHSEGKPTLPMISPDAGADQLIWIAEGAAGTDWQLGEYYDLRKPGATHEQANDADLAVKLWEQSAKLLGI